MVGATFRPSDVALAVHDALRRKDDSQFVVEVSFLSHQYEHFHQAFSIDRPGRLGHLDYTCLAWIWSESSHETVLGRAAAVSIIVLVYNIDNNADVEIRQLKLFHCTLKVTQVWCRTRMIFYEHLFLKAKQLLSEY